MGRLQRKKNPAKVKKKKNEVVLSGTNNINNITVKPDTKSLTTKGKKKYISTNKIVDVGGKTNFLIRFVSFIRDSKLELKKVVWPSRKQTIGSTIVVIVVVSLISLFLGIIDAGLSSMIRAVLG